MIYAPMSPRLQLWITRLARLPRWVWIAFIIGVIVPIVVLGASLLAIALVVGTVTAFAALLLTTIIRAVRRLCGQRTTSLDAGRCNVRVVVSSAGVIDP
jgi:hypothetical protein